MMVESLFGIVWDVGIHLDMELSSGICWAHWCLIFIIYSYCLLYIISICCIVITTKRLFTLLVITIQQCATQSRSAFLNKRMENWNLVFNF